MFDRFTDRAKKIMALARQETERLGHPAIGPEHILFGLMTEGTGVGANVLENLNVDLTRALEALKHAMPAGTPPDFGPIPFTDAGKKTLDFAIEEARALDHNYVGSEHLLLGLLRDPYTIAARVLFQFAVDLEKARKEVREFLGEPAPGEQKKGNLQLAGLNRVLELAGKEIIRSNSPLIEPEHLLAALVVYFEYEKRWDIDFDAIFRSLEKHLMAHSNAKRDYTQSVSSDSHEVMQLTLKNAVAMNASTAAPEHLLLGLLEFGRGPAFEVLTLHNITFDGFRKKLRPK